MPACLYRERVTVTKPLTLVAQPGAEIRGSDVWTGWTQSGSTWVSATTVPSFYNPGGTCMPGTSRCQWPEQVFIDAAPLTQVSSSSTPTAGQFKLDGSRRVVLGQSPVGRTVEVTVRDQWLWVGASDVTIDGFRMRHAAAWTQGGGLQVGGYWVGAVNRVTIRNNVLADAHGRIINLEGGAGHRILANDISRGGCLGIGGSDGSDWTIATNRIHHNATEGYDVGWESGGVKILFVDGLTVSGNEVDHNSRGVWTDTGVRNAVFANNRLHHNDYNGLFLESSHYLQVYGNEVWENAWGPNGASWAWGGGITLSSSDHAEVHDNLVAWNADGITVISQQRTDDAPHTDIYIHHNTIAMSDRPSDRSAYALAWVSDKQDELLLPASNNRGDNNRYWYPAVETAHVRFAWGGDYPTLSAFMATPGDESATYLDEPGLGAVLTAFSLPGVPDRALVDVVWGLVELAATCLLIGSIAVLAAVIVSRSPHDKILAGSLVGIGGVTIAFAPSDPGSWSWLLFGVAWGAALLIVLVGRYLRPIQDRFVLGTPVDVSEVRAGQSGG